ncbi:GHKL domain-containing protein [Tissierella pigra]|uniref:histidine kinase n=1 Tax=Tissierella pigra TaxID=2607614 RepID=A0A6N7Y3W1_9FIRM|nr:MASE3 domain-containing protein [Tissierella pigra]MBU5426332.1 GHKL domain-containing protein [Tissierella pigra]MSU02720.1 GHKL domain-containing protein [Tissierella pigra]
MESIKYTLLDFKSESKVKKVLRYIFILGLSMYLGYKDFEIYHLFIELAGSIISFLMAIIALNTYKTNQDNRIIFLGMAFGFVACFDLIHLITYEEIGIIGHNTYNISLQLLIVSSYMKSLSFLISIIFLNKKIDIRYGFFIYLTISILLFISILYLGIFPDCFIEEVGFTPFKKISQYIICGILLLRIIYFLKTSSKDLDITNRHIIYSLVIMITSEFIFIINNDSQGLLSIIGHIFKFLSLYLIYKAIVRTGIQEPNLNLIELNILLDRKNGNLENLVHKLRLKCEEMKRLETENSKKKEILDAILEASDNGILVIGDDNKVIHANRLLMEIWDISRETIYNGDYCELGLVAKQQLKYSEEIRLFAKELGNKKDFNICDLHLKDGRVIEASVLPFIEKGVPTGRIISFRDITQKNKVIELQKQIEIKQALLQKAKEVDEMKNNFFSTISHEFRTPLNIILGVTQLFPFNDNMEMNIDRGTVNKYIKMIKQNSYRLIKLSNNLIDITKIDAGFMKMNFENYNIVSIIEDITLSVVEYSKTKGISIVFDTEIEERIMACDADKLERVMLNLLSNSVKYVEPGGKIEVSIKEKNNMVLIEVKDNGVGIPKEMTEIIFDRFKQVDSTLRRKKEGSGIGLSIVKSMVELHGGSIYLDSEVNKGSTFTISLPIYEVDINNINSTECMSREINVDKINIEFSDIYELSREY